MIVYHGSTEIVEKPEIRPVSRPLDFGAGFYVTSIRKRAEEWAQKKAEKEKCSPVVNIYEINLSALREKLKIKIFKGTSDNWLDFVLKHRKVSAYTVCNVQVTGTYRRRFIARDGTHHMYDIVMGEVANDDVFDSIEFYESGVINKNELKRRLKTKRVNDQLCLCTDDALSYLTYVDSINYSFSKVR